MSTMTSNKYRAAIAVLQRGRDVLVETIADEILEQGEDLVDGGYQFNEFLESQGTRLHFLSLLVGQLELSAEALEESERPLPEPPRKSPARKTPRPRSRKVQEKVPPDGSTGDR